MAILSQRDDTARVERMPGFEGRYVEADGYTLGFETFDEGGDFTPLYRGLPNDLCQSHHWGYVISGRIVTHRPEGDEIVEAGEAYYAAPGHTTEVGPGTRVVEFSPSAELALTLEALARNMESAGA